MGDRETGRQSEKDKVLQGKTRQSDDETASAVREPKSAKASGSKGLLRRAKLFLIADFLVVILVFLGAVWYAVREYMETPPYLDEARFPVRGIDISSHNGMMNLEAARADGIEFAFIKASEGESFGDPNFALNHEKATAAGMKVGAYHFSDSMWRECRKPSISSKGWATGIWTSAWWWMLRKPAMPRVWTRR